MGRLYHNGQPVVNINHGVADSSDATATASDILTTKTAYINNQKATGTMPNNGAVSQALNAGGSYTIPQGYHNGSGKVTANSLASQTQGTATASDIANGLTAWVNGAKLTGTKEEATATITVTYDSTFYNKTMTCTKSTKTYTKTTTSSGSTTFNVNDEGTWTITCNGVSVTVAVVLSYSTQMIPTGSTATPVNDIQTWLKCGGIFDKTYTTINQVLADTTTLLALISDSNAVDYMVRSTNWASSVCGNSTAMTYIGNNNYCADKLLADSTWRTAICNSTYFESVLKTKVPTMTSNTAPSGVAFASNEISPYLAWCAFDGIDSSFWAGIGTTNNYIGYKFTKPVKVNKVAIANRYDGARGQGIKEYKIQGSNDNSTWTDIASGTLNSATVYTPVSIPVKNDNYYQYYRVLAVSIHDPVNQSATAVCFAQFYGR